MKPGDTIEVHWVHSSCDIKPGETLGSCLTDFDYSGAKKNGFHQAKAIPSDTGAPVVFRGSTTGPKYTQEKCSPYNVTWSVRPECAKLDIASLHKWVEQGNVFNEGHSHGARQLVTAHELLAPIR